MTQKRIITGITIEKQMEMAQNVLENEIIPKMNAYNDIILTLDTFREGIFEQKELKYNV